jgi:large subunit ribosomal protein L20
MPRAVSGIVRKKRTKKILKRAKGFYGRRSKIISIAAQAVKKALANSYIGRKLKKRQFRSLWNIRISAAAKEIGISYSKLIFGLKKASIRINRKMLSHLAISDSEAFNKIAEIAKQNIQ